MRRSLILIRNYSLSEHKFGALRSLQPLAYIGNVKYTRLPVSDVFNRGFCQTTKSVKSNPGQSEKNPAAAHVIASQQIDSLVRDQKYDEAHNLYTAQKNEHENLILSDFAALSLALQWLKANRIEDARKLINDTIDSAKIPSGSDEERLVADVLTTIATVGDANAFQWYADKLVFSSKHVSSKTLDSLMSIQLTHRNDITEASSLFQQMAKRFKKTPLVDVLLVKLIDANDFVELKKITDTLSRVRGETSSLYASAFALTSTGHINEAKQIFGHHSKDTNAERIDGLIEAKINGGEVEFLQNLLMATEDQIPVGCRRKIFEALLIVYGQRSQSEKFEEVVAVMKKENIQPTTNTERISKIAKSNNLPIPSKWKQIHKTDQYHERTIEKLLNEGRCQEANTYFMSTADKRYRSNLLKFLLRQNAEAGLVQPFHDFRQIITDKDARYRLQFNEYECRAFQKAEASTEYIEALWRRIKNAGAKNEQLRAIVTDVPFAVMELMAVPSAYEQLKEMATYLDRRGFRRLVAMVWVHNFVNDINHEDNARLWANHLQKQTTVAVRIISETIHKLRHPERHEKLKEFLITLDLSKIAPAELGRSYSYRFFHLLNEQRYNDLLDELKIASIYIKAEHLQKGLVSRMKSIPDEFSAKAVQMLK